MQQGRRKIPKYVLPSEEAFSSIESSFHMSHNPLTPLVIMLILSPPQWYRELGKEIQEATANGGASEGLLSHCLTNDMPSTMAATFLLMLFYSFSPSVYCSYFI